MQKIKQKGSKLIPVIIVLAVLLAAGFGGYYYYSQKNIGTNDDKEIARLEKIIGKLIILPADEKPVLATIKDATALAAQQPFFAGSQNGDKLLVYSKARKAFIYSDATGKLVNVGPIVYDQNNNLTSSGEVETTKTKVIPVASTTATTTKKK